MTIQGDKKMWREMACWGLLYFNILAGSVMWWTVKGVKKPPLPSPTSSHEGWNREQWNWLDRKMSDGVESPTDDDSWCWKGRCGVLGVEEEH